MASGDHESVAGAELRLLEHDGRGLRRAPHRGGDIRHVGREHDHGALRPEVRHDREHVVDHRAPGQPVQHLGPRRFHPRPLTRREYHHGDR